MNKKVLGALIATGLSVLPSHAMTRSSQATEFMQPMQARAFDIVRGAHTALAAHPYAAAGAAGLAVVGAAALYATAQKKAQVNLDINEIETYVNHRRAGALAQELKPIQELCKQLPADCAPLSKQAQLFWGMTPTGNNQLDATAVTQEIEKARGQNTLWLRFKNLCAPVQQAFWYTAPVAAIAGVAYKVGILTSGVETLSQWTNKAMNLLKR